MTRSASAAAALLLASAALAQPVVDGFDWVTVGDPGNPAIGEAHPTYGWYARGRGSVASAYRMACTDLTTAQYIDFYNTFSGRVDEATRVQMEPLWWGASINPHTGVASIAPGHSAQPAIGISWRAAAMFCNWMHNGRSSADWAILSGAYDVSTFGEDASGNITDQPTRSPGAKYWLPSWDEWLKAAHYDPNRNGPGEGGWWMYPDGGDEPLTPGWPGDGETSYGLPWSQPDPAWGAPWQIPVGAYPDIQSPWGLLDLSGTAGEWTEEIWSGGHRVADGSSYAFDTYVDLDNLHMFSAWDPADIFPPVSIRLASAVPAPGGAIVLMIAAVAAKRRRR